MLRHSKCICVSALMVMAMAALSSCQSKTEFRLSGEVEGLHEADFYVYATDGSLPRIDTLHLEEGRFDWRMPLQGEATLFVVYPNHSEQVVFARGGKHVHMQGDASHLRAISVGGTHDNEELTRFRLANLDASPDSMQRAMEAYVEASPESTVGLYLQHQLLARRAQVSSLRLGGQLPDVLLPPDVFAPDADTIHLVAEGRPRLLVVWAAWKRDSRDHLIELRRRLRDMTAVPDSLRPVPLSVSLDIDASLYTYAAKHDSVDFDSRCYMLSWQTPLCRQIELVDIPFYVLTDNHATITALGTDWQHDIVPVLERIGTEAE